MSRAILPDLENEPTSVKTLFPDPDYFSSWSDAQKQKKESIDKRFEGRNPDIVGITHTDADGYGCEVMLREAYPNKDVLVVTASTSGPLQVSYVAEYVAENTPRDTPVYIMDLSPNDGGGEKFIRNFQHHKEVIVIDHHDWTDNDINHVEWFAELYRDTDKCATRIVHDVLIDNPRSEITELAKLTEDHDLWIKEDRERSDALSDLAKFVERDKYVELARKYGDEVVNSKEGTKYIKQAQEEREYKTKLAIMRSTFHDVEGYKLGIAYGSCNASDVGEKLYTEHEADLACVMYPNGQLSFRSPEGTSYALEMARNLGGGGHPAAAGAKPDLVDDTVSYEVHWTTKGKEMRQFIVDTFKQVIC